MAPCPVCQRPTSPRPANRAAPFCSERCRSIDLGHWLDERYRVPVTEESDPEAGDYEPLGQEKA